MRGNGGFLKKLREGSTCTVVTHRKCVEWLTVNWPEDLEWPLEIPRPDVKAGPHAKTGDAA